MQVCDLFDSFSIAGSVYHEISLLLDEKIKKQLQKTF